MFRMTALALALSAGLTGSALGIEATPASRDKIPNFVSDAPEPN